MLRLFEVWWWLNVGLVVVGCGREQGRLVGWLGGFGYSMLLVLLDQVSCSSRQPFLLFILSSLN